ncbi:hypothetical protein VNI00_005501 [Paramarasmius palmivorus]|uniref:Uncharacterized protein n=1 Tax=Paramarasmius palmivorus TaxID=297713 RepID=A0AAW0DE18_9AGAR
MPEPIKLEKLQRLARASDPKVLKHIRDMLNGPVPTERDPQCIVFSRCTEAVEALEAYASYLVPCYYGRHKQATVLPGQDEAGTWVLLWKWFLLLEVWSPSFGGISTAPEIMRGVIWYNRVIQAIFHLIFVLVHHHADSPLTRLISCSESFIRFCTQVLFGALTVEHTILSPVVAVMVHSFWKSEVYDAASLPQLIDTIIQESPNIDFYAVAMKRFMSRLGSRSILSHVLELHALGVVLLQLYSLDKAKLLLMCAPRWFARCASSVMKCLRQQTEDGTAVSLDLNTEIVGKLLILCFRFLRDVASRGGSSGWVLIALNAGLFDALSSVKLFLKVEILRSRLTPIWTHRKDMISEADGLLHSMLPHLLTPSVLRAIRRDIARFGDRDLMVLPSWTQWMGVGKLVMEIYGGYKRSTYRRATMHRCSYSNCPMQDVHNPIPISEAVHSVDVDDLDGVLPEEVAVHGSKVEIRLTSDCLGGIQVPSDAPGCYGVKEEDASAVEERRQVSSPYLRSNYIREESCEANSAGGQESVEDGGLSKSSEQENGIGASAGIKGGDSSKLSEDSSNFTEGGGQEAIVGGDSNDSARSGPDAVDGGELSESKEHMELVAYPNYVEGAISPRIVVNFARLRIGEVIVIDAKRFNKNAVVYGVHSNLHCDKGFIRHYVQDLLCRREVQLAELRAEINEEHYIVFNFSQELDVLCLMSADELPEDVLQYRPKPPNNCGENDLVVVLCEKQSLVLWMWHGPLLDSDVVVTDYQPEDTT